MTGRRSENFLNGVDYSWHLGQELTKAVKQFHDRYNLYKNGLLQGRDFDFMCCFIFNGCFGVINDGYVCMYV